MIDLSELKNLLDKATPGPWETFVAPPSRVLAISSDWKKDADKFCISPMVWNNRNEDIELIVKLHNNAKELIRLAEMAQKISELKGDLHCESCRGVNSVMRGVVRKK